MTPNPTSPVQETNMSRTYVLVVLVEIVTLLSLYGLGRYFG